eukprot:scaffold6111_cov107-Isochrysis_galbana.AAC.7
MSANEDIDGERGGCGAREETRPGAQRHRARVVHGVHAIGRQGGAVAQGQEEVYAVRRLAAPSIYTGGPFNIRIHLDPNIKPRVIRACAPEREPLPPRKGDYRVGAQTTTTTCK